MRTTASRRPDVSRPDQRGFSLIIAMLMLAVIGLASAAVMRNATSADQVAASNRLQTQANQLAQAALRFCENQLTLPTAAREVPTFAVLAQPAWTQKADWTSGGPAMAHTLTAQDSSSAVQPHVAPQCMIEATATPRVFTVTARGFSGDFKADPGTGLTRAGAVVWLQSTVLLADPTTTTLASLANATNAANPATAAGTTEALLSQLGAGASTDPSTVAALAATLNPVIGANVNVNAGANASTGTGTKSTSTNQAAQAKTAAASACTQDCGAPLRQRVWQQLLTPPF